MIRLAQPADAKGICAIWNPVIRDTIATFNSVPKTETDIGDMIARQPTFVAESGADLLGFATYGQFRSGVGYAHTAEHTIHLAPIAQGQGIGRALMARLCDHAQTAGFHTVWAGISGENTGGVAFHAALGFTEVARLAQVGRKFDRWHDLILMQKRL